VCALGGSLEAVSTYMVSEQPVKVLIDTVATVSLLRGPVYDRLDDKSPLELYRGSLWSSSGHCLRVCGSVLLPVQLGSRRDVGRFYVARLNTNVQLRPGGQALVVCRVSANHGDSHTVLIEPRARTASPFRVTRSLCTATDGWVLVEVFNRTPDAMIFRKDVVVASGTTLPAETILQDPDPGECLEGGGVGV